MSTMQNLTTERERYMDIIEKTREMILKGFQVEGADDVSLILLHKGFYLQVLFSSVHPLIIIYLAKSLDDRKFTDFEAINTANTDSFMGSHSVNLDAGCYTFRSSHWLDAPMSTEKFSDILARCSDEALNAYNRIAGACCK